jgi:thioesterase domain-containing protein/ubiquinone/menaquinone biosynthesis C-methylase UbiE
MREWVDETVTRIMALKPQRVLEIGCGTGLLLARIAPQCESYTGTDFSETALNHTRQMCQQLDHLGHVTLRKGFADDFGGFEADQFDTILLNSVIQYFPDISYLERVIAGALRVLRPDGVIFIGDVRHYDLLETFHTSVQLHRANDTLTVQQLKQQIQRHQGKEKELLIAPDFFLSLAQQSDSIGHVQVQPKYGQAENELTKFRYDAILHVGHTVASQSEIVWHDWRKLEPNLGALKNLLESDLPFGLRHVPNRRLRAEQCAEAWLREAGPTATVADYRHRLGGQPEVGISLNQLRKLTLSQGWQLEVSWLNMMRDGEFELVFSRSPQPAQFTTRRPGTERSRYANVPAQKDLAAELIPHWQAYLKAKLPDYMLPTAFILLDEFPLTPNGKIDRKVLPAPDRSGLVTRSEFASPQTPTEASLAVLWGEVLGLGQVGRYDNFFELGGHSLLATRLVARIRGIFKVDLSLRRLFERPTLTAVADFIDHPYGQTGNEQVNLSVAKYSTANTSPSPTPLQLPPHLITLQPEGGCRPLFLVHPLAGLVFPYHELALHLGADQPVYGLQSIGIAGEASPLLQIESMAEHYLAAIRQVQPEGPYQLAGWSFGGTVALEMAQQLQKRGESVSLLGIIDTRLYSNRLATFWHGFRVFLTSMLPQVGPYISDYLSLQSASGGETQPPKFKAPELKRLLQVFGANVRADSRYRPQRYPGKVTLFKTAHQDSSWGWSDIAANGVELHQIPGHHMNVLRPPQVQVLAEKLSACLTQPDEGITPYPLPFRR